MNISAGGLSSSKLGRKNRKGRAYGREREERDKEHGE